MVNAGWVEDVRTRLTTFPMMSLGLMLCAEEASMGRQHRKRWAVQNRPYVMCFW
jgi:hypothetical protein